MSVYRNHGQRWSIDSEPAATRMDNMPADLDPRWEWCEVTTLTDPAPCYIQGACRHLEVIPVASVQLETVAHLCLTCDTQLPAEWRP